MLFARPPDARRVRAPAGRRPGPQPLAGRLRAPSTPSDGPASARSSSTTSTTRSPTSVVQGERPARRRADPLGAARRATGSSRSTTPTTTRCGRCAKSSACPSTATAAPAGPTTSRPGHAAGAFPEIPFYSQRPVRLHAPGGRVRAVPGPQVRADRDGLRRGSRRCSSQLDDILADVRRNRRSARCASRTSTCRRGRPPSTSSQNCCVGVSPRPGRHRGRASTTSASTGSCGAATTPTTRARTRSPREHLRQVVPRLARARAAQRSSPATPPSVYGFDLDALEPSPPSVGPTVAEVAEPLDRAAGRAQRGPAAQRRLIRRRAAPLTPRPRTGPTPTDGSCPAPRRCRAQVTDRSRSSSTHARRPASTCAPAAAMRGMWASISSSLIRPHSGSAVAATARRRRRRRGSRCRGARTRRRCRCRPGDQPRHLLAGLGAERAPCDHTCRGRTAVPHSFRLHAADSVRSDLTCVRHSLTRAG